MGKCWSSLHYLGTDSSANLPNDAQESDAPLGTGRIGCLTAILNDDAHESDAANATAFSRLPNAPVSNPVSSSGGFEQNSSQASTSNSASRRLSLFIVLDGVERRIEDCRATPLASPVRLKDAGQNLLADISAAEHLDKMAKKCEEKVRVGFKKSTFNEVKTLVKTSLEALKKLDRFASGIAVMAYSALQVHGRVQSMEDNEKDILNALEGLVTLCRHILKLNRRTGLEQVTKAEQVTAMILIHVAEMCRDQYSQSPTKRFFFVNITTDTIKEVQKDVHARISQLEIVYREVHLQTLQTVRSIKLGKGHVAVGKGHGAVGEVLKKLRVVGGIIEPGARAILIHGVGGIGKTTLGDAVCAAISIPKKRYAKVEMGGRLEQKQICNIQMQICERLFGLKQKIGLCQEGREILRRHISECEDPILLFVDDVFSNQDMNELLPNGLALPDRSRLIVTSRVGRVPDVLVESFPCDKYEVGILDRQQSEQILYRSIQDRQLSEKENEVVSEIVDLCGGLPLALQVAGGYLRNCDGFEEFTLPLDRLKRSKVLVGDEEIMKILRWSYNRLGPSAKELFLDICTLLRNEDWIWVECLASYSDLQCLQDFSLVSKMTGESSTWLERDVAHVHDLLATLGEKRSSSTRLGLTSSESLNKLSEANMQACEGLVMDQGIPVSTLDAMHGSLRILKLGNFRNESHEVCKAIPIKLQFCSIRGGLNLKPPPEFPYADISRCKQLKVLDIKGCIIPNLKSVQLPDSLKYLRLDLPLGNGLNLKTLYGRVCGLRHLVYLDMSGCHELETLPEDFVNLHALRVLSLSQCEMLAKLSYGFGNLVALQKLHLNGCKSLNRLPEDFVNLHALSVLSLFGCEKLEELPDGFGHLAALEKLHLDGCKSLSRLPEKFFRLYALRILRLSRCEKLEELPEGFGLLAALEELDLHGCKSLRRLPEDFGNLQALSVLSLFGFEKLEELPEGFGHLAGLEELHLDECKGLSRLPEDFVQLYALRILSLSRCEKLEELPYGFGHLAALEELHLDGCKSLSRLPEDFVQLYALRILSLSRCEKLEELPYGFGHLAALEELHLDGCKSLSRLPDGFGHLAALENLHLRSGVWTPQSYAKSIATSSSQ